MFRAVSMALPASILGHVSASRVADPDLALCRSWRGRVWVFVRIAPGNSARATRRHLDGSAGKADCLDRGCPGLTARQRQAFRHRCPHLMIKEN